MASTAPSAADANRAQLLGPNMLRNLKPKGVRTEYPDDVAKGGVRGLWLRVTPADVRTWVVRMRDANGQTRRFQVGTYPNLGLAEAREAARTMQQQVRHQKRDPVRESRQARARAKVQGDGTIDGMVSAYFDKGRGKNLRTADEQKSRILAVFHKIKDRALPALTADDLRQAVQAYPSKSVASAAAMYLKAVLRRLGDDDAHLLTLSTKLKRPESVREESRCLGETDIRKLLLALPDAGANAYGDALRLILWTAARKSEVTGMRWQELDHDTGEWTVPEDRMKATRESARRSHMRKLPRQALALLAVRKAAAREGAPAGAKWRGAAFVFPSKGGAELGNWDRWLKALQTKAGVADFSLHDLRRTAATLARELGTAEDTIDKGMLAHTPPKLARIHIRAGLYREAGLAMQGLADRYDMLTSTNVIQLRRA